MKYTDHIYKFNKCYDDKSTYTLRFSHVFHSGQQYFNNILKSA